MIAFPASTSARVVALAALVAASAVSVPAKAFQTPARFLDDPAQKGGGGSRFFTGSPADGYTCKVCHAPGAPMHVTVMGLPMDGYVPGQTYTITLDWPDDLKAVGLNLEITSEVGSAAGEIAVPPIGMLTPADLCSNGKLSGSGVPKMEGRAVVLVGPCGQHQTTLTWKAPTSLSPPAGAVWFSGSLVVSDGDATVAGDRVTDIRRALVPVGGNPPLDSKVTGGCAMLPIRAPSALAISGFGLGILWARRRLAVSCKRPRH